MSKLAALAAARKKKEAERQKAQEQGEAGGSAEETNKPLSLRDRLAGGGKSRTPTLSSSRSLTPLRGLSRSPKNEQSQAIGDGTNTGQRLASKETQQENAPKEADISKSEERLAAGPSDFATIIIGERDKLGEPASSVSPRAYNLFDFVVQDLTEVYNFAEPSPDDVVINAQNAAKGLLDSI